MAYFTPLTNGHGQYILFITVAATGFNQNQKGTQTMTQTMTQMETTTHHETAEVQAFAKIWVTAKQTETDAGKIVKNAKSDRSTAANVLAPIMEHGDTVTVNGNARYEWKVTQSSSVAYAKVVEGFKARHPEFAAEIDGMVAAETSPYNKFGLKRVKI